MKVLMTEPLQPVGVAVFEQEPAIEVVRPGGLTEEDLIDAVAGVEGIAVRSARLTPRVLAAARDLRAVARHGVGFDNVHVPSLNERGIPLLLAVNANAVSVAEHTMFFMLSLAKRGREYERAARNGDFSFRSAPVAIDIAEKSMLIVGFGRIGTRLAPRALAFDMKVYVYDPYVSADQIRAAGCVPVQDLHEVLPEVHFVTVHCPLNDETRGLIGRTELDRMHAESFVINCARGGIVDEEALCGALAEGRIAGAGIDVYVHEPPAEDNPLLSSDRVYLSPHSAGVSVEAARRMSFETADNLVNALKGNIREEALANPPGPSRT